MVTSDAHGGLKAALKAALNGTPWQRCQFHLQQNAQEYVTKHLRKRNVSCYAPRNGLWLGMLQTVEAEIDEHGKIRLLEPLTVTHPSRVSVTILPSHPKEENETALLSEASLAVDWNRKEEDEAWAHLQ